MDIQKSAARAWWKFEGSRHRFFKAWNKHASKRTFITIVGILIPAAVAYVLYIQAPAEFPVKEIVTIPSDLPLKEIASTLEEQHVVRSALTLQFIVRAVGGERRVHAGDYQFPTRVTVFGVTRALIMGAYGLEPIRVRIVEGTTAADMAKLFDERFPRFSAQEFITLAQPHEGYLFPDTYFFLPNATAESVLKALRNNFDARIVELDKEIQASGRTLAELVVMASLLEKEAHTFYDRRMIAGVLWNRIEINMPLQVDAAFLYINGKSTFTLTLRDLQIDSPYNTYRYKGLPPGAITNPSLSALRAAATPIKHDYLFYLADYSHVTHYSETYEEHLRKKRQYLGT